MKKDKLMWSSLELLWYFVLLQRMRIQTWKYSLSLVMTKRPNSLTSGVCCTAGWLYSMDSVKLTSLLVSNTTAAVLW